MTRVTVANGMGFEYEAFGSSDDPPLLMVMGLGAQLVSWPRDFCRQLADGGRYVISFDNRDCGLSERLDGVPANLDQVLAAAGTGDFEAASALAAYTLSDMADDGFALLDALGIERAHVLGASLGGMIAQTMAIEHPERVLTLTSVMSTTGEPGYGQSTPEALAILLAPSPEDRDGYIAAADRAAVYRSRRYPDLDEARDIAAENYDRGRYPEGSDRQLAAIVASGSRATSLAQLSVPTLVIHGLDDTLVTPSGGERTAELIPGAKLVLIEDMGHDRPRPLRPRICREILEHTV